MSSRSENLALAARAAEYRILPKGILQVPIDPSRRELSLRERRDQVADHNTDPKHIEGSLWGSPDGCHNQNLTHIIPVQQQKDGRATTIVSPAPYFEQSTLNIATSRKQPSRETLLSLERQPVPTTLTGDLPSETRMTYMALKLAGFKTAVAQATPGTTPVVIEHNVPFVSNGRPVCRTVPDPHSTVGLVDAPQYDRDYKLPTAQALEQKLLTPEEVVGMAVLLHGFIRTALIEEHIDPQQVQVVPRIEEPKGPCIEYVGIDKDNLTHPNSIELVSAVSRAQLKGIQKIAPPLLGRLPDTITMQGESFQRLHDPAYREIMHLTPDGKLATAISPIIVYSPVGGMEACGVQIQRGEEFPRKHTEETIYQYRQTTRENIKKTLDELGQYAA